MDDQLLQIFQTGLVPRDFKAIEPVLNQLHRYLTLRTYLGGYELTATDRALWSALYSNKVALGLIRRGLFANITRWFSHLETTHLELVHDAKGATNEPEIAAATRYNIKLQDTEKGVVTRFPPEPS
jgi:glutamyl-tRNA synthetase